jgi:hypothetical protein
MSLILKEIEYCFKVTANLILRFPCEGFRPSDVDGWEEIRLVHGIVVAKGKRGGLRVAHSWLEGNCPENGPMVAEFQRGKLSKVTQDFFYERRSIEPQETVQYSRESTREMVMNTKSYGPWRGAPAIHLETMKNDNTRSIRVDAPQSQKTSNVTPLYSKKKHPDPLGLYQSENASQYGSWGRDKRR